MHLPMRRGFTLIELLVVISIIAILMAVATVSYTNAQQKGRDNKRKSDLKGVQQALELFFQQNGKYPEQGSSGRLKCLGGSGATLDWGSSQFICNSITYMNPLPKDPITGTSTQYYYWSDNAATPANATYKIFAKIENVKDQDLLGAPTTCNTNTPGSTWQTNSFYYCVFNP